MCVRVLLSLGCVFAYTPFSNYDGTINTCSAALTASYSLHVVVVARRPSPVARPSAIQIADLRTFRAALVFAINRA